MLKINKERRAGETLLHVANRTVQIIGSAIFIILSWYALRYTQYMNIGGMEKPINVPDSMTNNIVVALVVAAVLVSLSVGMERISPWAQKIVMQTMLILAMLWIGIAGMWWISAVDRVPEGDQAFLYAGASYFMEENYVFLDKGGYCDMYPHQLALMALMEILFHIVGPFNYFAYQVICVFVAVGIVYLGYCLISNMTENAHIIVLYCFFMMLAFPLIFYTGWVYGDVPSIFFALLAANFLIKYQKNNHYRYLGGVVFSVIMALLVRKNSLILLIALFLVGTVYAIWKRDRKILVTAVLTAVLTGLIYSGVYKMYELRSGYEHNKGIPTLSWIAMGMMEHQETYGWYWDYAKPVYYENGCDRLAANEVYKQDIRDTLAVFKENPSYARSFYREKVLSQWNEPLYQSLFFSNKFGEGALAPEQGTFAWKINNEYFVRILWICDRLQFLIYVGMACYFLFAVKKESNILQHLLAITMIGGFFFSILWEAKARYILPYYVTMFPCAVIGYEQLLLWVTGIVRKLAGGKQKVQEEKIRKAA